MKITEIQNKNNDIISFVIKTSLNETSISFEAKLMYKNNQWKVYNFLNRGSKYEYFNY